MEKKEQDRESPVNLNQKLQTNRNLIDIYKESGLYKSDEENPVDKKTDEKEYDDDSYSEVTTNEDRNFSKKTDSTQQNKPNYLSDDYDISD